MIRNLKAMGLSLIAVLAMCAVSASSASAVDKFTSGTASALMTGTSHVSKFDVEGTNVKFECTTARYAGTAVNNSTEATVDALYNGTKDETPHNEPNCNGAPGNPTAIDMEGCHYVLTGNTTGSDPPAVGPDATVWITCPAGKVIKITTALGLTLTVPGQTPTSGGVTYTNKPLHPQGAAVEVNATVTGITYNCHGAIACGLAGLGSHGNKGTYTDTVIVTGYNDLEGLSNGTPVTEGLRTPITVVTE